MKKYFQNGRVRKPGGNLTAAFARNNDDNYRKSKSADIKKATNQKGVDAFKYNKPSEDLFL